MSILVLSSLLACKRPPEAPRDLDELSTYLYEHHVDDDPEALAVGLGNLRTWFETEHDPDARAGFELTVGLSQAAVDALDGSTAWSHPDTKASRASEGMGGAAAGTVGLHRTQAYVDAMVTVDQDVVFPKTFKEWGRTWRLCDGDTFASRDCLALESDEQQHSDFGLTSSVGEAYNQYRWVELEDGQWAMTHRNWQIYPPEVTLEVMEVVDQYYLNVFVPGTDGTTTYRYQATWAVFGEKVPEATALDLTTNSMFSSSDDLEDWLDENR